MNSLWPILEVSIRDNCLNCPDKMRGSVSEDVFKGKARFLLILKIQRD